MHLDEYCKILRQALGSDVIVKVTKPPAYIFHLMISHREDPIILVYKEGKPMNINHSNRIALSAANISGVVDSLADLSVTGQPLECPFENDDDNLEDTVVMDPVVLTEESFHAPLSMIEARKVLSLVFLKIGATPLPIWVLSDMSDSFKQFLVSAEIESGWRTRSWAVARSHQTEKIAIPEMLDDFQKSFNITSGYKLTSEVCCVFTIDNHPGMPKHSKCYLEAKWKKPSYEVPVNQADSTLIVECSVGQAESQISRWWDQLIHLHKYLEMIKEWKQSQLVQVTYHRDGMKLPTFNSDREGDVKKAPLSERLNELLQSSDSMSVCRHLESHVNLTSVLNSTIHELLTDKQKGQDFTDRLWSLLIEAETYQELKESFRLIIREVRKQSVKPYIFVKNRTRLASLLRNIKCSSSDVEFMMEPLELLVEMGLEKLKRDYMFMFLASNITSEENLSAPKLPSFSEVPSHEWQTAVDTWLTWLSQLHTVLELVSVIHTTMSPPIIMQFTGLALSKFVCPDSLVRSFPHIMENRCYQLRAPVISKEVKTFIEGDKIFHKWMLKLIAESKYRRASSTYVLLEQSPLPQQISLVVEEKSLNDTDKSMPALLKINSAAEYADEHKNVLEVEVQEEIYERVAKIKQELAQGVMKPFNDIIETNDGDSSIVGNRQITFIRQVTALACLPDLLMDSAFPDDVKMRVRTLLQHCQGNSIGSLTEIEGLEMVRRHIADYIHQRDDCPASWEDIIIVPGVSAAVKICYKLMNYTANRGTLGILSPVPEFPLFSSALSQFGIEKVPYYLDEKDCWSVDVAGLEQVVVEKSSDFCLRAILVINPGNPTGQVLTRRNMEEIVKFAHRNSLLIIACEVYQDSVYRGTFSSFKKVVFQMESPYNHTELVSLMSSPKGYAGETGMRAGYMELYNVNTSVKELLRSSIQIADSPPICAQIALDCMACPPLPGQPSYPLFHRERISSLESLEARARLVYNVINHTPGLSCSTLQGGFFAFIKVDIPESALDKANRLSQCPSTFYCLEMLDRIGVVTVPGAGFGQKPGSHHFRISILLSKEVLEDALHRIQSFHLDFTKLYN